MFGFVIVRKDTIRALEEARDVAQNNSRTWSENLAKCERANAMLHSDLLRLEAENEALRK